MVEARWDPVAGAWTWLFPAGGKYSRYCCSQLRKSWKAPGTMLGMPCAWICPVHGPIPRSPGHSLGQDAVWGCSESSLHPLTSQILPCCAQLAEGEPILPALGSPRLSQDVLEVSPEPCTAPGLQPWSSPFPGCSPEPRGGRGRGGGAPDFLSARGLPVPARRCRRQSKERLVRLPEPPPR